MMSLSRRPSLNSQNLARFASTLFTYALAVSLAVLIPTAAATDPLPSDVHPDDIAWFETNIRPLLVEHCYECHSAQADKLKGGLHLDSQPGWRQGGDSGPALIPGKPDESLLIEAVRYRNADLEMPPKGKLSDEQIRLLESWVSRGAPDPRLKPTAHHASKKQTGMSVDDGRSFWSYHPPTKHNPPRVSRTDWPHTPIDQFILARLESHELPPAPDASPETLVRRIYFDLTGLPPTVEEQKTFLVAARHNPKSAASQLIDRLLQSPRFGERWARHWLDVVRFAESVTLRGFVFPEAWRYRDYVIDAFNRDLPYNRFLREQVAGDLLDADTIEESQRHRVATTFLTLGNNNYEEQDKGQLDMDVVDELLDVMGKAFLGQTIACARCHDHKFDPIPTRDYYALAGILKGMQVLEHANVSKWIEQPMPLPPEQEAEYRRLEEEIQSWQHRIKETKNALAALREPNQNASPDNPAIRPAASFPGLTLDDSEAERVGEWKFSQYTKRYIENGYIHDLNTGQGTKTVTFQPLLTKPGLYEVRFAYTPGGNRASRVPVTVFSADGETTKYINQKVAAPIEDRFVSLGTYRFETNGFSFVVISNEDADGHVTVDAMQFLSQDDPDLVQNDPPPPATPSSTAADKAEAQRHQAQINSLQQQLSDQEKQLKTLQNNSPQRPMVMTVQDDPAGDIPVHIRGTVHNLGDVVPRGFLQVAATSSSSPHPAIPPDQSGRRQLADWLADEDNPLTARVLVNRVWLWLMGSGLVRTPDNFGTTGSPPTHPELLDWMAIRFMEEGWSVKWLIREIMHSRAYAMASHVPSQEPATRAQALDPDNRLRWRMERRRLDAESLRDAMLAASGQLNLAMGGPTYESGQSSDYGQQFDEPRRSVYVPVLRNSLPELFEVFDFADPSMVVGKRNVSTVAPQALYLLNHPFVQNQAELAAQRLLDSTPSDPRHRITQAYRQTLGRAPSPQELELAQNHLLSFPHPPDSESDTQLQSWTELYHALFGSMDFRYLN